MDYSVSILFGTPEHEWLPVEFNYKDFHLRFSASGVLNSPIRELYDAVSKLQDEEVKRITWWLEPGAYFFDFQRKGQNFVLTITSTDDLHGGEWAYVSQLIIITGSEKEIIEPFRMALKDFSSLVYEEDHWQHVDKDQLKHL